VTTLTTTTILIFKPFKVNKQRLEKKNTPNPSQARASDLAEDTGQELQAFEAGQRHFPVSHAGEEQRQP
jgi:hypothetical protein